MTAPMSDHDALAQAADSGEGRTTRDDQLERLARHLQPLGQRQGLVDESDGLLRIAEQELRAGQLTRQAARTRRVD